MFYDKFAYTCFCLRRRGRAPSRKISRRLTSGFEWEHAPVISLKDRLLLMAWWHSARQHRNARGSASKHVQQQREQNRVMSFPFDVSRNEIAVMPREGGVDIPFFFTPNFLLRVDTAWRDATMFRLETGNVACRVRVSRIGQNFTRSVRTVCRETKPLGRILRNDELRGPSDRTNLFFPVSTKKKESRARITQTRQWCTLALLVSPETSGSH